MKIGITGATGHLGRMVVNKLKEQSNPGDIVALVRSPEKAGDLGVETRFFDYSQPEILPGALKGIDHLLLISASEIGKRREQHINIISAAKKAGVKWIVYTSLLHVDTNHMNLAQEHIGTEEFLKESGVPYTILRNGWYTENYMPSVPGAIKAGALIGCAGDGKISSAAREDYADVAVTVLLGKGHEGKVYELAGDDCYTLADLAEEISKQTGKNIPYKNLSEADYTAALISFGIPEAMAQSIANWDTGTSKGDLFEDNHLLSKLIGRPTIPMAETVREALV